MINSLLEMAMALFEWTIVRGLEFLPEILGVIAILCLMGIWRRIRIRRRLMLSGKAQSGSPASEQPHKDEFAEFRDSQADAAAFGGAVEKTVEKTAAAEPTPMPPEEAPAAPGGFFKRLQNGLAKTRQSFGRQIEAVLSENQALDEEAIEGIEEALITADVGVDTTRELIERISGAASRIRDMDSFKALLKTEMRALLEFEGSMGQTDTKPHIIMVVGVNGVGKTTSIGKLAFRYRSEGKKVILGAADTFRAAAVEQLEIWAQRADAEIVKHRDKADPAAVAYDTVEAASARKADVVIIDTAGRLHTKVNLMEQLKKIKRTIARQIPDAPHEILLVVDATTGQNAISQAKLFHRDMGVTGIVLSKLDGTAKGGIVLGISHGLNIPIRYIGVGEQISDLQVFDPQLFVDALL